MTHKIPETEALNQRLRYLIEKKLGIRILTPKDFTLCRDAIFEELRVNISISTLKRYWGYVSIGSNYLPNRYTLNTLAKFVGFTDWDDFCSSSLSFQAGAQKQNIEDIMARIDHHAFQLQEEINTLRAILSLEK